MLRGNKLYVLIVNFLLIIFLVSCRSGVDLNLVLNSFNISSNEVLIGESVILEVDIDEGISEDLNYIWMVEAGEIKGEDSKVIYYPPKEEGVYQLTLLISDNRGQELIIKEEVVVIDFGMKIIGEDSVYLGESLELEVVSNIKGLNFSWEVKKGEILGQGDKVIYNAPDKEGVDKIKVAGRDELGREMVSEAEIEVEAYPIISDKGLTAQSTIIAKGQRQKVNIEAFSTRDGELDYKWKAKRGEIIGQGQEIIYLSPKEVGEDIIKVSIVDESGFELVYDMIITVIDTWERSFGGVINDGFESGAVTEDGYLIVGYTTSFNENSSYPKGYAVGVNESGDKVWSLIDSSRADFSYFRGVSKEEDGEYILVGARSNLRDGSKDGYILRIDGIKGEELARYSYGGLNKEEEFYNVVKNSKGDNLVVGYTYEGGRLAYLLEKSKDKGRLLDIREYKYNHYDGGSNNYFTHLLEKEEGYLLAGYTSDFGSQFGKGLLVEIDKKGNLIESLSYDRDNLDLRIERVLPSTEGGYLLVGALGSPDTFNYQGYVIKVDQQGRELFSKSYGFEDNDSGFRSGVSTVDGGYLLLGYTGDNRYKEYSGYLLKIDSNGKLEWERNYNGRGISEFMDIIPSKDGGYLLIGYTAISSNGSRDAYLLKVDPLGKYFVN
ncbi:hypothetical protein [Halonatronum saccharophilum]|uniref:hypothetical protein n=1 Tax=Halonatronum saccharophilum TaxID=150060 RepID=UPI00048771C3|nr:hypothetical protein [Halonatronum saccharophilum]